MRKWIAVAIALALATTSCAATWTITGHAPTQDDNGACGSPILVPTVGGLVRVQLSWVGPANGTDTKTMQPGAAFSFTGNVPSGNYTFTAVCLDSAGNASCPATVAKLVRGNFAAIQDLK
jgi:hypothetical protein